MSRRKPPRERAEFHPVSIRVAEHVYRAYLAESARRSVKTGIRVGFSQVMHEILERHAPKGS